MESLYGVEAQGRSLLDVTGRMVRGRINGHDVKSGGRHEIDSARPR